MSALLEHTLSMAHRTKLRFSREIPPPQPGEAAMIGDIYASILNQGLPLLSNRQRRSLTGADIVVNRPAYAHDGTQQGITTDRFAVADGATVILGKPKEAHRLVVAAAHGEFDPGQDSEQLAVIGGVHPPLYRFMGIDRQFRDPTRFSSLVSEPPGHFMHPVDYLSFRVSIPPETDLLEITTGDWNTKTVETVRAADLLNPDTRPEAITVVTGTILTAIKEKFDLK